MDASHCSSSLSVWAWLICILMHINVASSLSWRGRASTDPAREQDPILKPDDPSSQLFRVGSQSPTSYEIALNELKELESEPLCHRTAARLLVNNCQLLEGKDEATILTNSGRKIRDFVDSYAASLAICDLERGRFTIPTSCAKFREPTLSQLPIQSAAYLHVTSVEIDGCLSGLGASDSAWNTWVSYRHKALRFCEAARADNEKAENVILFRRLTTIMSRLTDDIDAKMEQRMNDLDSRAQMVGDKFEGLFPLLGRLQEDLESADSTLFHHLQAIKQSNYQVHSGLENAMHLDKMLQIMLKGATDNHAEVADAHDQSLQLMSQRVASEMEIIASTMAAAIAATEALQYQIETSRIQAADLESRQNILQKGMQKLVDSSDALASKYDLHTDLLQQAQNITNEILQTLGDAAVSAVTVSDAFLGQYPLTLGWPYILCPIVSLVLGSYGLPPSLLRNLILVSLGGTAGFIISSLPYLSIEPIHGFIANWSSSFMQPLRMTNANYNVTNFTSQPESH